MSAPELRVAVAGGGWAGCAAAVELARQGCQVTLFEAARSLGGRARGVEVRGLALDNGQHILLGAYRESLRLMKRVGVDEKTAFLRLPVQMRYPEGGDGMDFAAPRLPAPLHLAFALLRAKGLDRADKLALARFNSAGRWMGWQLDTDCTVLELLERFDQTERLARLMWRPLCIAALNTPPERASANVFLAVLRDSLGARRRAASDMLLPRLPMGALFPEPAGAWLERQGRGHSVRLGVKVAGIKRDGDGWLVDSGGDTAAERFDAVVLATPAPVSAALLAGFSEAAQVVAQLEAFTHEPIATCYLQYAPGTRLALPFYALLDDPAANRWGQFVFDRAQLDAAQDGLLAVVVSAAAEAASLPREQLAAAIASQLAEDFGRPELATPSWTQLITEKRATFSCTPALVRPGNTTALPGLVLAGDYTASDYPATLETAVRSGQAAATAIRAYGALPREKRSLSHADGAASGDSVR
ncbi:hydroxysqualene dehydroxylase HpnE [Massilia sp. CFBP9026]|uniref:hydroxysqualene dehydroxylase HpnE n=1 Tax=Massilia sp. CFBP9026 TaxID=3096536 RepID=UPI002A698989|nr:hydroxysqualene dehydroxylase HpnE [Massilia sp. CFBP9026]MDY0964901.1 hydroxysqualene dehydroxylase HpnE [Massilia sp. CFBP9026]